MRHLDVTLVTGHHGLMKIPITLNIEPSQLKRLKAWSKETGSPVSEIIRRAIEAALKAQEQKK
jgi:predicted DNA-binding protein